MGFLECVLVALVVATVQTTIENQNALKELQKEKIVKEAIVKEKIVKKEIVKENKK